MRALVTNDDGVASDGLRRLALAAVGAGLDTVVAAPLDDSSGASASLTSLQADGRVVVEERDLEGLAGCPVYGVGAVPAFITLIATRGAFGPPPDLVLSGVNRGLNTGRAVLHSGTVGAALTASAYGHRAAAISVASSANAGPRSNVRWDTVAAVADRVVRWIAARDDVVVLNVNVPNVDRARLRGLRRAGLASFGAVQTKVAEVGKGFLRVEVADADARHEPESDAALVAAGYATVTALSPFCESREAAVPCAELSDLAEHAAAAGARGV